MTTKQRTISPRIDDITRDALANAYGTANAGATTAVRSWMTLRERTLLELDSIFAAHEWEFIDDAYHGNAFDLIGAVDRKLLLVKLEIAHKTLGTSITSWDNLAAKLNALTVAQRYYLVEWACMPARLK